MIRHLPGFSITRRTVEMNSPFPKSTSERFERCSGSGSKKELNAWVLQWSTAGFINTQYIQCLRNFLDMKMAEIASEFWTIKNQMPFLSLSP